MGDLFLSIMASLSVPSASTSSEDLTELSNALTLPPCIASLPPCAPFDRSQESLCGHMLQLVASLRLCSPQSSISSRDRLVPFLLHLTPSS